MDVDVDLAHEVRATAGEARRNRVPGRLHGDVAEGDLLLRDGRLSAV